MAGISRIFRRCTDEPWWHWRTDCIMFKTAWSKKRRGKTFVYLTLDHGSRPTTHGLCPGCMSLDERIRTSVHVVPLTRRIVLERRTVVIRSVPRVVVTRRYYPVPHINLPILPPATTLFNGWSHGFSYL
jgi:hypothetical protein